jgi:hypothetical protein
MEQDTKYLGVGVQFSRLDFHRHHHHSPASKMEVKDDEQRERTGTGVDNIASFIHLKNIFYSLTKYGE